MRSLDLVCKENFFLKSKNNLLKSTNMLPPPLAGAGVHYNLLLSYGESSMKHSKLDYVFHIVFIDSFYGCRSDYV